MNVEDILKEELGRLLDVLGAQVKDPKERLALAAMANDMAMLPVWMAQGRDVSGITAALKAETMNRALAHRVKAQTAAQQAWMAVVSRIILGIVGA